MAIYNISEKITEKFNNIDNSLLINTLFEMNKYFDSDLKNYYKDYKIDYGVTLDSFQRKMLKNYFYYNQEDVLENLGIENFPKIEYTEQQVKDIEKLTIERIEGKNSDKIINSIKTRLNEVNKFNTEKDKCKKWLKEYSNYNDPALIIFNINQRLIDELGKDYKSKIFSIINYMYDNLMNYRHVAVITKENLVVDNIDITWDLLSEIAVYMENFINFKGQFKAFNKEKKIKEVTEFLNNNNHLEKNDYENIVKDFYNQISTGFVFNDLLISDDEKTKILIMRKIKLDETPIQCPSCLETTSRGNSYPLMFQKSWECQNPKCPERSKSGRGKRYDEYGVFRYYKLVENNPNNQIDREMYMDWHRDVFSSKLDIYKMLLMYYTWNNERIYIINDDYLEKYKTRNIEKVSYKNIKLDENISIESLNIYKILSEISNYYKNHIEEINLEKNINIINEDSTIGIQKIKELDLGGAITSPPYYNAREYSNWPNLLTYLIDMMLNAKSIFNSSKDNNFTYLYNVGDIVDNDNVYVTSNMSRRRIMLGFYSALIFKIVGFKVAGNIIWDKGEVESKRNSTVNLVSGYIKYINCYEHVLILKKEYILRNNDSRVCKIKPVYKINSKGENTLGHTAPYPTELVELIRPYIIEDKYVLDPFLGSGTTGIWCKENNFKFLGFELSNQYYELAKERIEKHNNQPVS